MNKRLIFNIKLALVKIKGFLRQEGSVFILLMLLGFIIMLAVYSYLLGFNGKNDPVLAATVSSSVGSASSGGEGLSSQSVFDKPQGEDLIWLDIGGAVLRPGIHYLRVENGRLNRLYELVDIAGGFKSDADQDFIARKLNLAAEVSDGEKVYIPFKGEFDINGTGQSYGRGDIFVSNTNKEAEADQVSVNKASMKELESLKGVGEVRAGNIVQGRPYESLNELVVKKILTEKIMEDNRDIISL